MWIAQLQTVVEIQEVFGVVTGLSKGGRVCACVRFLLLGDGEQSVKRCSQKARERFSSTVRGGLFGCHCKLSGKELH